MKKFVKKGLIKDVASSYVGSAAGPGGVQCDIFDRRAVYLPGAFKFGGSDQTGGVRSV